MSVIEITDETSPGSVIIIDDTSSVVSVQETSNYVVSAPYVAIERLTQLRDTPDDVQGKANQALTVKADETGLEFTDFQSQIDSNDSATSAALSSLGAQVATKLNSSNYTAQDVLAKIKTVDGSGSGLDADTLDGISAWQFTRKDESNDQSGAIVLQNSTKIRAKETDGTIRDVFFMNTSDQVSVGTANAPLKLRGSADPLFNNDIIWTSGNDGSGSGLDADRLDGKSSGSFLRSDAADSFSGKLTGNTLSLGSSDIMTSGAKLQVNGLMRTGDVYIHEGGSSPTGENKALTNNTGALQWDGDQVWHMGNMGSGSGLDADKLGGIASSQYLRNGLNSQILQGTSGNQNLYLRTGDNTSSSAIQFGDSDASGRAAISYNNSTEELRIYSNGIGTADVVFKSGGQVDFTASALFAGGGTQEIWHAGNDGAGSGLDADKLDGVEGSQYARLDQQSFFQNGLRLLNQEAGDATAEGSVIFDSSQGLMIRRTQQNVSNATVTILDGANVEGGANVSISNLGSGTTGSGSGTQKFTFSIDQGAGSGLDADTLDGKQLSSLVVTDNSTDSKQTINGGIVIDSNGHVNDGDNDYGVQIKAFEPGLAFIDKSSGGGSGIFKFNGSSLAYIVDKTLNDGTVGHTTNTTDEQRMLIGDTTFLFNDNEIWHAGNDGAGSGLDADTVDGVQAAQLLRSDTDDVVTAGVTYSWDATNVEGLRFKNASYGTSLYVGGWSSSNTAGVSRIRCSNDNLHIDSGADGDLYLNSYSAGEVKIHSNIVWHAGNDSDFMKNRDAITTNVDLNTYQSTGVYHQSSNARATDGSNYPVPKAGCLEVIQEGSMTYQRYTIYNSGVVYTRSRYGSWSAWQGGLVTVSTSAPSGGNDGDVWYQV